MNKTEARQEKRKNERFTLTMPYTLVLEGKRHSGITRNISLGGVYTEAISPPIAKSLTGQGGEITLQLESKSIVSECMIVYVGGGSIPYPTGVGILYLDPGKRELVGALQEFFLKNS